MRRKNSIKALMAFMVSSTPSARALLDDSMAREYAEYPVGDEVGMIRTARAHESQPVIVIKILDTSVLV